MTRTPRQRALTVWLLALFLGLGGCALAGGQAPRPVPATGGTLTLFLQPLPQEAHPLNFTMSALAAIRADGARLTLPLSHTLLEGAAQPGRQQRLVTTLLPPGRYEGLFLEIGSATLHGEEGPTALLAPKDGLEIRLPFTIIDQGAEALFLSLAPEQLITNGVLFTPTFTLWQPERLLISRKGFASDPTGLTIFDKRAMQAVGALSAGGPPAGLALDQQRGWLYVALPADNLITVLAAGSGEILGQIRLRFGDEPVELALSSSGRTLLCLNRGSSSVSIIDTAALFERSRIVFATEPSWLIMGHEEGRAYVTEAGTGTLSLLDLDRGRVVATTELEDPPVRGAISRDNNSLFLVSSYSGILLVVDAASLAVRKRIFTSGNALALCLDPASGLLYVALKNGEIAVVDPAALMLIDAFRLPGPVTALAIDHEENVLFALAATADTLWKVDLVSKRGLGEVELAGRGHGVVVMGQR
jgi:DNA-binding beta-propeller fold protein YncE